MRLQAGKQRLVRVLAPRWAEMIIAQGVGEVVFGGGCGCGRRAHPWVHRIHPMPNARVCPSRPHTSQLCVHVAKGASESTPRPAGTFLRA